MPTPGFIAQDSNSLTPVRYYTPFDPYHYTVDNRPLQDLATNISTISTGGGDSARRAVLLSQLALSSVFWELFSTSNPKGFVSQMSLAFPGANTIQIQPGALYQLSVLNESISTPVIKQGLLLAPVQLNIVPPVASGQSIDYLVQIQYQDLSTANMPTSPLPFLDASNVFLPCLLLNGQVAVQVKTGSSAPTGSQVTPTPDTGWTGLYVVTATYGQANPTVRLADNAPDIRRFNQILTPAELSTPAPTANIAGIVTPSLTKGSTDGVGLPIVLKGGRDDARAFPNPYEPIKLRLVYSSNQAGGNFALRIKYLARSVGDSVAASYTTSQVEAVPMNVSANSLLTYNLETAVIPPEAFAGFLNGVWSVTKEKLFVVLERPSSDPADTATGAFYLHDVIAFQ